MRKLEYPCQLTPDGDGFLVTFPDVPEALTGGGDRAEALDMAADALSVALTFYLESVEVVPPPSRPTAGQVGISPSLLISLKAALADALRESGRRPADLARLLDTDFKSAKRLLDPNHASRIPALEQALAVLGKRVTIATEDAAA